MRHVTQKCCSEKIHTAEIFEILFGTPIADDRIRMQLPSIILMIAVLMASSPGGGFSGSSASGPSIVALQRKALEHARLSPSEITSWKKRARFSALVPRLQLDYSRRMRSLVDVNINDSVYVGASGVAVGPEAASYKENADADQNIGIKAVWNFSEAVFNPEMLAISEEARLLARERQGILAEVNRNYYERTRTAGELSYLENELKKSPRSDKLRLEVLTKRVAFDEATSALDALTDGWFSDELKRSREAR